MKTLFVTIALWVCFSNGGYGSPLPEEPPPVVGADECTWGPGFWCATLENAQKCEASKHCEEKVWNGPRPKTRRESPPGSDPCTWGPDYWCKSLENAEKCETKQHCVDKVWNGPAPRVRRQVEAVGKSECTWGPGFWCDKLENAQKCGNSAVQHCQEKVWNGPAPKQ